MRKNCFSDAHFLYLSRSLSLCILFIAYSFLNRCTQFAIVLFIWWSYQINSLNQLWSFQHFSCSFYSKFKHSWFIICSSLLSFVCQTFYSCCFLLNFFFFNFGSCLLLVFSPWKRWMPNNLFEHLFIWYDFETIVSAMNYTVNVEDEWKSREQVVRHMTANELYTYIFVIEKRVNRLPYPIRSGIYRK